jgi:hypothetical protein
MTIPVWPSDLPQRVLANGFQSTVRGNRLTTAMDTGPGKQRKRGALVRPVSCSIIVTADQRAQFDVFYEEDCAGGTIPFLIPDQQTDGLQANSDSGAIWETESGAPVILESWWFCQFGATQPATTLMDGITYTIQFDLVVLP